MKKYAIVKTVRVTSGYVLWEAHRYNLHFKIFGPGITTEVFGTDTSKSADDAEQRLIKILANMGKQHTYEIVRIVEH